MTIEQIASRIDAGSAQAFVRAARHVIDAMMIEANHVQQTQTPGQTDYANVGLTREAPAGGWISRSEIHAAQQQMTEAISAEKWVEGFAAAVRVLQLIS